MKKTMTVMIMFLTMALAPFVRATVWSSNGSVSDVQNIHDTQAVDGDTITMPPGPQTWANGFAMTKGIIFQGTPGSTVINRGTGYTGALVTIAGFSSDVAVQVTGIKFNSTIGQSGDLYSIYVNGPYGGAWGLNHVRIDHCYFVGGERTIFLRYRVNGVADHNTFKDCAYITEYFGDDDFAWTRAGTPSFGTPDAFFFEDNQIIADSAITYFDTLSDQNTGGKLVWRKNNFNVSAFTGTMGSLIGEHGNQAYWAGSNDWLRGGIMCEFYSNTVKFNSNAFRLLWFRGGRNIVANNKFQSSLPGWTGAAVSFDEEEAWGGSGITPARVYPNQWPAEDQVNNTFIWGNTVNGVAMPSSMVYNWNPLSDPSVMPGRDYWLQAPSAATQTIYTQPTSPPSLPAYPLPYNPAVTSWTAYTYPHPLVH